MPIFRQISYLYLDKIRSDSWLLKTVYMPSIAYNT